MTPFDASQTATLRVLRKDECKKGHTYGLDRDFSYTLPRARYPRVLVTVPAGHHTDLASIPRVFWRILPPFGKYTEAAIVHDYLCDERPAWCDYKMAARIFRDAMIDLDVPGWKVSVMYRAVLWFGPRF